MPLGIRSAGRSRSRPTSCSATSSSPLGRNAEAEQAYRATLARAPGRTLSLQGLLRAQQALGKTEAAARTKASSSGTCTRHGGRRKVSEDFTGASLDINGGDLML